MYKIFQAQPDLLHKIRDPTMCLFHNIIMLILMLLYGTSSRTIFYFIVINTFIKVVPLYYLRNEYSH